MYIHIKWLLCYWRLFPSGLDDIRATTGELWPWNGPLARKTFLFGHFVASVYLFWAWHVLSVHTQSATNVIAIEVQMLFCLSTWFTCGLFSPAENATVIWEIFVKYFCQAGEPWKLNVRTFMYNKRFVCWFSWVATIHKNILTRVFYTQRKLDMQISKITVLLRCIYSLWTSAAW